jgi:hypothetical protein
MQNSSRKTGDDRTFGIIGAAMEVHRFLGGVLSQGALLSAIRDVASAFRTMSTKPDHAHSA